MSKVLFAIVMCVLTAQGGDWLLDPLPYRADVREDGGAWMQENGLARRAIATKPGVATVSLKCLTTDGVRPRGGTHILTSGADFSGATVNSVDAPEWVKRVGVDVSGNVFVEVKPKGFIIIVR